MANNDFFTEFHDDDLVKLFQMNKLDAFAGMDFPDFESMDKDFKDMETNLQSEFEFPDFEDFSKSVDFDFGFDFAKAEKEFNQQFEETAQKPAAVKNVFTKRDEAARKRAYKNIERKEKEKILKAKKQAEAKVKAEEKSAARKTPEFIQQIREKYYGFIDKVQRFVDYIEGERIEAETQRYIVAKYKKAEKAKLAAAKAEARKLEAKEPKVKEPKVRKLAIQPKERVDVLELAKTRLDNAYYTWAVVWDQLDEERELRKIDKLTIKHNKEYLQ